MLVANTLMWLVATAYMMAAARGTFGQTSPLAPLAIVAVGLVVSVVLMFLSWRRTSVWTWLMVAETTAGVAFQLWNFQAILYVA